MDFNNKFQNINNAKSVYDFHSLNQLKHAVNSDGKDNHLANKEVASKFEAIFIGKLLQDFRRSNDLFKSDLSLNSESLKFFQGMHDQQLAANLSKNSIFGIANLLNSDLKSVAVDLSNASMAKEGEATSASKLMLEIEAAQQDFINPIKAKVDDLAKHLSVSSDALINYLGSLNNWGKKLPKNQDGSSSFNFFHLPVDTNWKGDSVNINELALSKGVLSKVNKHLKSYMNLDTAFIDFKNNLNKNLFL